MSPVGFAAATRSLSLCSHRGRSLKVRVSTWRWTVGLLAELLWSSSPTAPYFVGFCTQQRQERLRFRWW